MTGAYLIRSNAPELSAQGARDHLRNATAIARSFNEAAELRRPTLHDFIELFDAVAARVAAARVELERGNQ